MITKVIAEEKISAVQKFIKDASKIVIVAHKRPDGDAIGSTLGLCNFLKEQGKDATVILPDAIPSFHTGLPGAGDIVVYETQNAESEALINECDLIFCLDFNFPSRIGALESPVLESRAKKVLVDHHANHGEFTDIIISHPEVTSTCELVFRLICRMGKYPDMSLGTAKCLCAGILTDTGGLAFNSNSPEIYSIISELLKKGVDKDAIYRGAFNNYSESRMKLLGYVLYKKMKVYKEYHTAIITLTHDEMMKFNYQSGDTEGFVNQPLSIGHVFCSIFIKEEKDVIKLSFRSQGDMDVNIMAKELFGGGGHVNASGAESHFSMEETVKIIEKAIPEYVKKN